jgi:hypothetical protein
MSGERKSRKYRGFISYSKKDKAHAARLHKALEAFRVPKGAAGEGVDPKTRRLGRFFRDDDEMGAASDLGAALRGAIEDAQCGEVSMGESGNRAFQIDRSERSDLRGHGRWRAACVGRANG